MWMGVPVSALGAAVYLTALCASIVIGRSTRPCSRRRAADVLAMASATAALSAVWLLAVQAFVLRSFCRYCVVVHLCGILLACLVLWRTGEPLERRLARRVRNALTTGVALIALLIGGQVLTAPRTYQIVSAGPVPTPSLPNTKPELPTAPGPVPGALRFTVGGRQFQLNPSLLPTFGPPRPKHFIVVLSDYTCEHCRSTHRALEELTRGDAGEIGVIVLPVPLDAACNTYIAPGATHPPAQDCELTRLALAVWCAKPAAFAQMDRWLFAEDRVREAAEARAYAAKLVGPQALNQGLAGPRGQQVIAAGCELFACMGSGVIPKVLIGRTLVVGELSDVRDLSRLIAKEWPSK